MTNILMKLGGAVFSATNSDFVIPQNKKGEGSGGGDPEETDDRQEDEGGDGKAGDSEEEETNSEEKAGGDDAEEGSNDDSEEDSDGEAKDEGSDGDDSSDSEVSEGNDGQSDQGDTEANNSQEAGGETGETSSKTIGDSLVEAMEQAAESGLMNNNSALQDAVEGNETKEHCLEDERVWRPYRPDLDSISHPRVKNAAKARTLQNQVKKEIAFLTNKLRSKFLQARSPRVIHGVRHGRELSERRLVESVTEIRSGRRPTRPDWDRVNKPECSLAVAVVLDQSGSMRGDEANVARAALAIATPMDKLGTSCLVIGPRSGQYSHHGINEDYYGPGESSRYGRSTKYHRDRGIQIDVFKGWDEPMRRALPRFSSVVATGGTPLSDGIQFAMQELSTRPERHRVIIVLTDGCPNCPGVVKRQIRLAKESGVTVVGVGISNGCYQVPRQFPENHVAVERIADLPRNMLAVLDAIMFPSRSKRIKLDGKISGARMLTA